MQSRSRDSRAGFPRDSIEHMCGDAGHAYLRKRKPRTAVGRPRIGVDAEFVARSAIVSQVRLFASRCTSAMRGNLGEHLRPDLIDDLLNASRFEAMEDVVHDVAHGLA